MNAELRVQVTPKGRRRTVSVLYGDDVILSDTADLSTDKVRQDLTNEIQTRCHEKGLRGIDADAIEKVRAELDRMAVDVAERASEDDGSQADRIVAVAEKAFRLGRTAEGEAFAVAKDGPNIATPLRGRGALRAELSRSYFAAHDKVPSSNALTDALAVLEGKALRADPESVHLRVARDGDHVVLDLGRSDGAVVVITADGWTVEERSPVLFRRTELTGELPVPERGGDVNELRQVLNVSDETWPAVVGWMAASFIPEIDHPIVMLSGLHGTGKSTAARYLAMLIDPSPAPLRTEPRDAENWAVSASGSWVIVLDNVSRIAPWLSDALCRATSGDGLVRRKRYSDADLTVLTYRRCIVLTSIDAGAFRGDLGDRLVILDLEPVQPEQRRPLSEMNQEYEACRARVLGAVLDLVAGTLCELPHLQQSSYPRMADYARILHAVDALTGMNALGVFLGQRSRIAKDVVDGDPVALAIVALADAGGFRGTPTQLYHRISPEHPPKGWPRAAHALSGRLKRLVPSLRDVGIMVEMDRSSDTTRERTVAIERVDCDRATPSKASEPRTIGSPAGASDAPDASERGRLNR